MVPFNIIFETARIRIAKSEHHHQWNVFSNIVVDFNFGNFETRIHNTYANHMLTNMIAENNSLAFSVNASSESFLE